jgi:hypothetical protein
MPVQNVLNEKEASAITDRHIALWNEANASLHSALISSLYAPEIEMIDSYFKAAGHDGIRNAIAGFRANRPGSQFTKAKPIDYHHNIIRLYWYNGPKDQPDAGSGMDLFVVEEGKVVKLYVFVDPPKN